MKPSEQIDQLIVGLNDWRGKTFAGIRRIIRTADPDKLYNNGLLGKKWRTIDYFKDDKVLERGLKDLVRSAVAHNLAKKSIK